MPNEEKILARLDRLEAQIEPLTQSAHAVTELRRELAPRVNEAVHALIAELADIEADFQIEDLLYLAKKALRNIGNLNFALDQLKNLADFVLNAEPLLKDSVPRMIFLLDELEQKGVFKMLRTGMGVLERVAQSCSPAEMEQIGDGLVRLMGAVKKLTMPAAVDLLEKAAEIPAAVDVARARPVGFFGMFGAMGDEGVKQGMGVLLELTRGLAVLKDQAAADGAA